MRPRIMSLHTFEFWIAFEDSDVNSRHVYYQQEVFHALTSIVLGQLLHPGVAGGGGEWGKNDESDDDDIDEDEDINDVNEFRKDDQV
jgi:hypothetical protein